MLCKYYCYVFSVVVVGLIDNWNHFYRFLAEYIVKLSNTQTIFTSSSSSNVYRLPFFYVVQILLAKAIGS